MKEMSVESIYGSVSEDGQTIRLQIDSQAESIKVNLSAAGLTPFIKQLLTLAVEAGQAQGIPTPKNELSTYAVDVPATRIDFGVASPTESVLIGRCGVVNVALLVPHVSLHQLSRELKELGPE
jgi:hypothetical protein